MDGGADDEEDKENAGYGIVEGCGGIASEACGRRVIRSTLLHWLEDVS